MDMNVKLQSNRKFKRVEKLMQSGLLEGFAQRVKVSFDFLDIENNGWFALKDLTERGSRVSSYLGLELDLTSTFSIMDAFRSFDVGIRGRVRLEDFGVSLIIRLLSYDDAFYSSVAHETFEAGFTSVAKFISTLSSDAKAKDETKSRPSDPASSSVSKIFSSVPFSSMDEDEAEGGGALRVPQSLKSAMGSIYYLLEDCLVDLSGSIETDTSLTVEAIEKVLRGTFLLACRELKIQLQLSQVYIEKIWTEKGNEVNDQTKSLAIPWDPVLNKHRKVSLEMLWKPPRKTEFGTRVQFEMTDATSLKGQYRRHGSVLAVPEASRGGHDVSGGGLMEDDQGGRSAEDGVGSANNILSFDEMMLIDQPTLDSSQLFVLKSAIQNIDNFFTIMQNPNLSIQKKRDMTRNKKKSTKSRFSILGSNGNRKITHEQLSAGRAKQLQDEPSSDPYAKKHLESELSLELMDTQDKLRRTSTRLEILEIIQMEMSESVSDRKLSKLKKEEELAEAQSEDEENNDDDDDEEGDEDAASEGKEDDSLTADGQGRQLDGANEEEVSFDEIMRTVQEVRALVSHRGSEEMLAGSLLSTPSALVPLQDVEDSRKLEVHDSVSSFSDKHGGLSLSHGVGEEKTQSHGKGILSKHKAAATNKKIQVTSLIKLMNSSVVTISEEMNARQKKTGDLEKLQLLARNSEEKVAEAAIKAEQMSRQDDNNAALSVEVQVLRDRIQHVSAMEDEIDNLKEKNLYLNRHLKEMERSISERKEGWNLDNLLADGSSDDIEGSSKTLADLENRVLTLKEENNDLRAVNAKFMKEQHQHITASKNAEKRLKLCLQDNLGLNQKMNRLEEDFNNSKIEVSDLLGQIEHQRDTEQERLQVAKKLHTTGLAVTELRGKLLEARAEALHASKLRDELAIAEARVAKLMEAASEAEITSDSNLSAKQEVEELNVLLREKMRENRELSITVRSLERKVNEGKTVQARLNACQDEVNRYKIKVEQCAPMLAEVARLRGAARAAVRSLQEQDKTIVAAEDSNKKLRKKLDETTLSLKRMEKIESKLIESESECARLSDIVLTEIPQLKEELANVNNEKSQVETQYRHIKKSSRQSAITGAGMKELSSAPLPASSVSSPSPMTSRRKSLKPSGQSPVPSKQPPVAPPQMKKPSNSPSPTTSVKKSFPPPPPSATSSSRKEDDKPKEKDPSTKLDGGSSIAKSKEALLAKFKPPTLPPASSEQGSTGPQSSTEGKKPPPPPPTSTPPSALSSLASVDEGGSMADNKAALMSLFKPR